MSVALACATKGNLMVHYSVRAVLLYCTSPLASLFPTVQFRDKEPVHVSTRSPKPQREPMLSGDAPFLNTTNRFGIVGSWHGTKSLCIAERTTIYAVVVNLLL